MNRVYNILHCRFQSHSLVKPHLMKSSDKMSDLMEVLSLVYNDYMQSDRGAGGLMVRVPNSHQHSLKLLLLNGVKYHQNLVHVEVLSVTNHG